MSEGQEALIDAINANDVVFGVGPPGSGKTRIAVAKAVEALDSGKVNRIVLVRPCLGLGRTSGFLPGTLEAKVSPYLRPLLDELKEFYGKPELTKKIADEVIELASLEFIRGRTFKHSFVILDEAQNATRAELKSFQTRLGEGSIYVITGDISKDEHGHLEQSDLHPSEQGSLEYYLERFGDIEGVGVARMGVVDCVRHPLVRKFLEVGL
jgi:phosphate starvation-inducible PhoH-like protein